MQRTSYTGDENSQQGQEVQPGLASAGGVKGLGVRWLRLVHGWLTQAESEPQGRRWLFQSSCLARV